MGTIVNYIRWRGDIGFSYRPLTPIDAVVLGQISYFDLRNVYVPGKRQTLGELFDRQLADGSFESTSLDPKDDAEEFLRAAAASRRFRNIRVLDYADVYRSEDDVQFAAETLRLDDGSIVVAFRGTDDTLAGWREDFMISFTKPESQIMALEYLKKVLKWHRRVYVCGHSKGGNLALYATCGLDDRQLGKVKAVFLNDSPGLCYDVVSKKQIDRIDPIATMIMPSDSVVGRIFEPELSNKIIVKSQNSAIMAHSGYSWLVEDNDFVRAESFSTGSGVVKSSLYKWLENEGLEQREKLVNNIFDILKEGGYERLSDFKEMGFSDLFGVFAKKIGKSFTSIQPKELLMNTVEDIKSKIKKTDEKEEK
ncbi:MAG: DUF2974 domain-containing protein [Firmicutes bacterium]|nr:DUF2974 domain-containing protein [Bacillota bacterium]